MKKQEFISILETEFNVDAHIFNTETVLTEIPDWDSMSILIIMSLVDEHFGVAITADDFTKIRTISDLFNKIGDSHFE